MSLDIPSLEGSTNITPEIDLFYKGYSCQEDKGYSSEFYEYYHKYADWKETPGQALIPNHPDIKANAPVLVKAIANHDYLAVEVFLEHDLDPQIKGWSHQEKNTPITIAITDNDAKMIHLLLQYFPDNCNPIEDLFISSALQMCTLPALKLLFDKGGGIKKYLQLEVQHRNEQEIRLYNLGIIHFKPHQECETLYGKCSIKTIDVLQRILLKAACCVNNPPPKDILEKERLSIEVIEYLLTEGWLFIEGEQVFNRLLDHPVSFRVFQKLLDQSFIGKDKNNHYYININPDTLLKLLKSKRIDIFKHIIETRQNIWEDHSLQIGKFFAEYHDFENYKYCFDKGMKVNPQHLKAAIQNIGELQLNKENYLIFIRKILELGLDPNCLPEAKSIGCRDLIDLLLEYGAKPV